MEHHNILKFVETYKKDGKIHIVTMYCEGGDLEQVIKKNKKIGYKATIKFALGMLEGCDYLFSKDVVHRDLKPANIFVKNR